MKCSLCKKWFVSGEAKVPHEGNQVHQTCLEEGKINISLPDVIDRPVSLPPTPTASNPPTPKPAPSSNPKTPPRKIPSEISLESIGSNNNDEAIMKLHMNLKSKRVNVFNSGPVESISKVAYFKRPSQIEEINKALMKNYIFNESKMDWHQLIGSMKEVNFEAGHDIIVQGVIPNYLIIFLFYVHG